MKNFSSKQTIVSIIKGLKAKKNKENAYECKGSNSFCKTTFENFTTSLSLEKAKSMEHQVRNELTKNSSLI